MLPLLCPMWMWVEWDYNVPLSIFLSMLLCELGSVWHWQCQITILRHNPMFAIIS